MHSDAHRFTLKRFAAFLLRVVSTFLRGHGLTLASALAYNALLSLVPLIAVILAFLSLFFDEERLGAIVSSELEVVAPGYGEYLTGEILSFVSNSEVFGGLGLVVLLFFSSLAFRILEDAMSMIFERARPSHRRHFIVSAVLPFGYIVLVGISLLAVTVATIAFGAVTAHLDASYGSPWSVSNATTVLLYVAGFLGTAMLFTTFYRVLPVVHVNFKRVLAGGVTAAILWEGIRHLLAWYFSSMSMVSVVYGSLATVIIILLFMEVGSVILLLGAQVIAELERASAAGVRWFEAAPEFGVADAVSLDDLSVKKRFEGDAGVGAPSRMARRTGRSRRSGGSRRTGSGRRTGRGKRQGDGGAGGGDGTQG